MRHLVCYYCEDRTRKLSNKVIDIAKGEIYSKVIDAQRKTASHPVLLLLYVFYTQCK